MSEAHRILRAADRQIADLAAIKADPQPAIDSANAQLSDMLQKHTADVLALVLHETGNLMKNAYARSDA
jgi:hypothetical protein